MGHDTLRIGFLSSKNYFDRLTFSGILYSMYQAINRHAQVVPLGRPYRPSRIRDSLRRLEMRRLQRKSRNANTNLILPGFRKRVEKQLRARDVDLVLAPAASAELSVLDLDVPVVYASDVTFRLIYETYRPNLLPARVAEREVEEQTAIKKATGITYSSAWAAESAVREYGASREMIRIIPYGANLDDVPDECALYKKCERRPWQIAFIGFYWHRKGGDIALKAFESLCKSGVDAELTIIGTEPPERQDMPGLRVIPFLDKRKARDQRTLREILLSTHFMLFPSRADCTPIALCEAAAYGVPVVSSDVGGIRSIVTERTGRLLPSSSGPDDYASAIRELIGDPTLYRAMVRSSRERFEEVLNWDQWAKSLLEFCELLV